MKTKTTRALLALMLAAAAIVFAACGSKDSSSSHSMTDGSSMTNMDHGSMTSTTAAKAGSVDQAFVSQMIPHHQMAVQMAKTAQSEGEHSEIKTLADDIVSAQTSEITELEGIAKRIDVTPASMGAEDQMMTDAKTLGISMDEMGMSMDMNSLMKAKPFDREFIDMMIPHHQGAIRMARAELAKGTDTGLKKIATAIIAAQTKEITEMNSWRKAWYGAESPAGGVPQA